MSNTQKLAYSVVPIHDVFTDRHECTAYAQRHRQSSEMIFATGAWKLMRIAGHCLKGPSFASSFRVLAVWYQPLVIVAGRYQFFLAVRVLAVTYIF